MLVLGPADAGKSSLCRVLLAAAAAAGRAAALLDTDLGQKVVGPPACVTLGRPGAGGLELTGLAFAGETDPVRAWGYVAAGVGRLAAGAGADLVVADSDGLVAGPGRRLKAALIRAFGPDLLLALGGDPALEAVLADHAAVPTLKLTGSPLARRKTTGQRRAARREAFRRYFENAEVRTMALRVEGQQPLPPRLLASLADRVGCDLGLAIVLAPKPASGVLTLLTPVAKARRLRPGGVALSDDLREIRPVVTTPP